MWRDKYKVREALILCPSSFFSRPGTCCGAQASLELMIFLPQGSECWDHKPGIHFRYRFS